MKGTSTLTINTTLLTRLLTRIKTYSTFFLSPALIALLLGSVNAAPAIAIDDGSPACNETWTRANSPHVINATRIITAGQVVCVEAGSVVSFTGGGKIDLYGQIRALGTAADRITFTGARRIEVVGVLDLRYTDVSVILNINSGGTLLASNSNFRAFGAIVTFFGLNISSAPKYVSLENVVFDSSEPVQADNAQLFGRLSYLLMNNVTFRNAAFFDVGSSWSKFQNVLSENSAYEGMSFVNASLQPTLLENIRVMNCARGGFDLFDGNYFIGSNVTIENCEYPISGKGGLLPGSSVPTTGNRNNWIEVGEPGGDAVYSNVGIPYVVSGFANIAPIEFLPGVTLKARNDFAFNTGGGIALRALGRPGAPITFQPLASGQTWNGGQYNSSGDRMDYVILEGMRSGVLSAEGSGSDYYIDNSIIRNNTVGVVDRLNSNGAAYLQTNLFTNNQTAIRAENARIQAGQRTNPNLFENNSVAVNSTSSPDVRFNWWNSPTGPTTNANPGGTGDLIIGGARFLPFLTTRPDTTDRPPVVRMPRPAFKNLYGPHQGFIDPGTKVILKWEASDDRAIVKQKILFSRSGNARKEFTLLADNLPPGQRSFELTVPGVGFVQGDPVQFIRVVAVDGKGQEGFDDWQPVVPSGEIYGQITITANVAGRVFRPGDEVDFTYQVTSEFPGNVNVERFIVFDADRKIQSYGANTVATMPPISTDTARLMIMVSRSLNQRAFFFSEPFSIRPDTRFPDAAPQVSLNSPTPNQEFTAGAPVPIQWSATDDEAIRYFNIQTSTDGGRTWIQTAENLPPTQTSFTWQPEIRSSINDVRVRVIAVDRRFQNSSATRTVRFVSPPNQPPSVQVTFPANNAGYFIGQSIFIAANASDPDGVIQRVEFYAKGGATIPEGDPELIGSDTTAPYQVPWVYPLTQSYIVTARAFDNRNQMVTTSPITVRIQGITPAPLPIGRPELTNPVDGAVFAPGSNITLEGAPAPTNRTILRLEFYNGTTLVGTDTTAPYSITLINVPQGNYTFFVKSVADNGAESISPVTDVTVGTVQSNRTPFDFDGDGKADISVFRPSDGNWYALRSSSGFLASHWGISTDRPMPADYDGDGKTDLAVFRRGENSTWYILNSLDSTVRIVQWGATNIEQPILFDTPAPADYDGDGKADLAVWRTTDDLGEAARFVILQSSSGSGRTQQWGSTGDRPVPSDFDGDDKADLAIYRSGVWWILRSTDGGYSASHFGLADDKAVAADYDGDDKSDLAVFRPSNGTWYVFGSTSGFFAVPFGVSADVPAPADFDGDRKTDFAVYRDGTWHILGSVSGYQIHQFGLSGDQPIPGAFVR